MNSVSDVFFMAKEYLESNKIFPSNISNEMDQMQKYVSELDPQHSQYSSLSAHRKRVLEEKITACFGRIQQINNPPQSLTSEGIHQSRIESLDRLSQQVQNLSAPEFHKVLKNVDSNLREKIYRAVRLVSGCPREPYFSEQTLKRDTEILKRSIPLFTHSNQTILEQIRVSLQQEHLIDTNDLSANDLIEARVKFFQECLEDKMKSHRFMKVLFQSMHPRVQDRLRSMGISPPFYGRGIDFDAYRTFGAHYNGYTGCTTFQVYAPNASQVILNLTAFAVTEESIKLHKEGNGIWSAQTYNAKPGRTFHYMITDSYGRDPVKKVDPFAFSILMHPSSYEANHESVVVDIDKQFEWSDEAWMQARPQFDFSKQPLNIYEIHSPSWRLSKDNKCLNWRDLAPQLAEHCKTNGYNAVELMAVFSHPMASSMGYQITSFFAPHPEMGSWEDFQFFINYMHTVDLGDGRRGICVFVDWVPAHFAVDSFALAKFDGSPIFEPSDSNHAYSQWGSLVFDLSKTFTRNFLGSNACFLLGMHVDGLRADALSSMLYLNREKSHQPKRFHWKPIAHTEYDTDVLAFFRNLNTHIHMRFKGVSMIAEEAYAFPNLTRSPFTKGRHTPSRGVGFDYTWHMGFTNDTLEYWEGKKDFDTLVKTLEAIDGSEDHRPRGCVVLPYSHDENATGKKTLFSKMSGETRADKFANGRLAVAFLILRGGGIPLNFMGTEFLQTLEWHSRVIENMQNKAMQRPSVQWEELDPRISGKEESNAHLGALQACREINKLFLKHPALWNQTRSGFSLISTSDSHNCVVSFHRHGQNGERVACIFNTGNNDIVNYYVPLPYSDSRNGALTSTKEIYNTDERRFGGKGRINPSVEIVRNEFNQPSYKLRLAPYTAIVLEDKFN